MYCKTFFEWYIFHKSLFVWHLTVSQSDHMFGNLLAQSSRFAERFLIIFFEVQKSVAFNGNYQFVNLQKTIVSLLFNICIMKGVKNVLSVCPGAWAVHEWPKIAFSLFPELDSDNLELTNSFIFIILITATSFDFQTFPRLTIQKTKSGKACWQFDSVNLS